MAGVAEIAPDVEVLVEYIGDTTKAFDDPTQGEALSNKMYDDGACIIYHAAGDSGNGLFKAAAEQQMIAIGVDSDQHEVVSADQAEWIMTSMIKRVDTAVYDTIVAVQRRARSRAESDRSSDSPTKASRTRRRTPTSWGRTSSTQVEEYKAADPRRRDRGSDRAVGAVERAHGIERRRGEARERLAPRRDGRRQRSDSPVCSRTTTSRSTSAPVRCMRSSARTAPASPP